QLRLKPAPVSTQTLQRDRHAFFLSVLAVIASSLEKFATEIRNLQRTEILEAEEFFAEGQKGSSAMPHKRNPLT
ncbi:lyase family protein, partial [Klebsiella pneumoniae]|uniref:lyase family protein n=1 Tax=Klebsiella pneumoniae TaxID=573 RepID=UPI0022287A76